jgi:putative addiction module killer protein
MPVLPRILSLFKKFFAHFYRRQVLIVSLSIVDTMIEIRQTEIYARWFNSLRDRQARARIDVRIRRLSLGNPGDVKPIGKGVSELRIDYGPGYRVYFLPKGDTLIILLAGGDKHTQARDIQTALDLAQEL